MKRYLSILILCALCAGAYAQETTGSVALSTDPENVTDSTISMTDSVAINLTSEEVSMAKSNEPRKSLITYITDWYSENTTFWSITALMTVESSFIPFPSEVIVPPAVYVASQKGSPVNVSDSYLLNVFLIVLFASLGAMLGAVINYWLSVWLGRPIIYKFADSKIGHLLLLSSEKIKKSEDYFNKRGKLSTFIGRLIPAVRQLISIPAGLARMPFGTFLLYTFLGAFCWNCVLAILGYIAHGQMDLIEKYNQELSIIIVAIVGVVGVIWASLKLIKYLRAKKDKK